MKIFFCLLFVSSLLFAQESYSPKRNNIYVELLGNSVLYSLNYDRLLSESISVRVGFMALPSKDPDMVWAFPVLLNYKFFLNRDYFEVGVGKTFFLPSLNFDKHEQENSIITGTIGYCTQFQSGIFLRLCFTPIIYINDIYPFGGLSVGYNF